ncbi:DUF937 domain-containing protein [Cellulomonas sp. HZM]|uniref:DUF937 domain-containing protein n=1 Tax=Cellulomonas sp. HZM TaxID=1454010 RepID=UPI0004938876|nr:DUF937 domain-containing protein [Cellulomonas sp. HZM]
MTELDDLERLVPLDQLASHLGVDEDTARDAVRAALPALVGGMQANAQDAGGAASLLGALQTKDTGLVDGGVDLGDVDADDGRAIVRNVFGAQEDQVAAALGAAPGKADSGIVQRVLPMLAPIVMAFLARKLAGGGRTSSSTAADAPSQGGLGDILGGLLGGLGGGAAGSTGGLGGLGDVLGGLLGGGKR